MSSGVLVFDMDGVLVDVSESYRETIRRTVEYFTGRRISHELIQEFKNQGGWNNDWELSHRIIRDFGCAAAYEDVVARFQQIFLGDGDDGLIRRERWAPAPGLLERLAERFRLAVFTGRLRNEAFLSLRRFAPEIRFDPVIACEDVARPKPAPDGLLRIAELAPSEPLWYVGDTIDDLRSASAAGVRFIGIASRANPRREELARLFRSEGALAVLEDVNQLEAAL